MNEMITIKQGESETLQINFVNETGTPLPDDLSADMTIKFPAPITQSVSVADNSAVFDLTPTQTSQKLSSYRFNIKLHNASNSYVKYLSGEILIKDPFDD